MPPAAQPRVVSENMSVYEFEHKTRVYELLYMILSQSLGFLLLPFIYTGEFWVGFYCNVESHIRSESFLANVQPQ